MVWYGARAVKGLKCTFCPVFSSRDTRMPNNRLCSSILSNESLLPEPWEWSLNVKASSKHGVQGHMICIMSNVPHFEFHGPSGVICPCMAIFIDSNRFPYTAKALQSPCKKAKSPSFTHQKILFPTFLTLSNCANSYTFRSCITGLQHWRGKLSITFGPYVSSCGLDPWFPERIQESVARVSSPRRHWQH